MAVKGSGVKRGSRASAPARSASPETPPQQSPHAAPTEPAQPQDSAPGTTTEATENNATPASAPAADSSDRQRIAVAAYYRAQERGFTGDQQIDDWLAAERSLAAESALDGD